MLEYDASLLPEQIADSIPLDDLLDGGQPLAPAVEEYDYGVEAEVATPTRPINWISGPNLKAGASVVLGDDLLGDQEIGYAISGGFRCPIGPAFGDRSFVELGGSYLSAFGEATRTTAGLQEVRLQNVVVDSQLVPGAFASTLHELRRGSVHAAVGWYWGSPADDVGEDPQVRYSTRLGGRVGHVRGRFSDVQLIEPPSLATQEMTYGRTDTFGGVFVGGEAVLLQRQYSIGHIQWTVDGELGADWIDFEGWGSGTLGSALFMFGFMLSR